MTKTEFMIICGEYMIEPSLALENENIRKAIKENDGEQVKAILENEF